MAVVVVVVVVVVAAVVSAAAVAVVAVNSRLAEVVVVVVTVVSAIQSAVVGAAVVVHIHGSTSDIQHLTQPRSSQTLLTLRRMTYSMKTKQTVEQSTVNSVLH